MTFWPLPGDLGDAELRRMLQRLLAERFHLTLHHEQREMWGYLLSVAPGGVKDSAAIHAAAGEGEPIHQNSEIGFRAFSLLLGIPKEA
nr:TIGR03435 family protein [Terriglobus albidus]